ncbi:MAG: hypothetical protein M3Y87_01105 [Myxococcota bacterium]|nr:hypothetical protein [Myxococcota bacterium]
MDTRTVDSTQNHPRITRNETIPRWSRRARLFLGVMTFALIGVFAFAAITTLAMPTPIEPVGDGFGAIQFVLVLATFMQFLLMLFYISFAWQNPRLGSRGAWIVAIVLLPWAILPIYWYQHIWTAPYIGDPGRDYNVPGGQMTPQAD